MRLVLDASTGTGTLALLDGAHVMAQRAVAMKGSTDEQLMPAAVDLVDAAGGWSRVTGLVVGGGPGGFTSLRIAAAIAKGLATSLAVDLWAVSSLALLVTQAAGLTQGRYAAALDAMRGEAFVAIVDIGSSGQVERIGDAARVPQAELASLAARADAQLAGTVGSGALDWTPHARGAGLLLRDGHALKVDLASWEPEYGRLAEAQVKWEAAHGRPMGSGDDGGGR